MPGKKPNILWICTDQQRYDTIHALGNQNIRTPNLDGLIDEGVGFLNAYSQSPLCTPSRASFLTGCYPSTLHVNRNGNDYFPEAAADRLITRTLTDIGYDCGMSGKLHLSAAQGRVEIRPNDGYRFYKWSHHPKPEPSTDCLHNFCLTFRNPVSLWQYKFGAATCPELVEWVRAAVD